MRKLHPAEIDLLRNWGDKKYPTRAMKWASMVMVQQIGTVYTLHSSDPMAYPPRRSVASVLRDNKKEYWQFLKDNKIPLTTYDKFLGNYDYWLRYDAK